MPTSRLPLVDRASVPAALHAQLARLETLGADTTFHRYAAHAPHIVSFYWREFYEHVFRDGVVPIRTKEVARLALAALSGCTFCRAGDVDSAMRNGLTQEQVDGVLALDPSSLPEDERVAFELAVRLSPFSLEEDLMEDADWDRLRRHFTDPQVVELLMCVSVLAGVGRMLAVTGFIPRTCDIPTTDA